MSGSISTSASIHVEAGSTIVTPASMCASLIRSRSAAATTASSTRVLIPSTSSGVLGRVHGDDLAVADEQAERVGDVELALGVVRLEPVEHGQSFVGAKT